MNKRDNKNILIMLLSFLLVVSINSNINKTRRINELTDEVNSVSFEADEYYKSLATYASSTSRLREANGYYEHKNNTCYNASDIQVITLERDDYKNLTLAVKSNHVMNISDISKYSSVFTDTPTVPYEGHTFDYESMMFSCASYVGMPAAFDTVIYSKSDDGVYTGYYHEIKFGDAIISERRIFKDGILQDEVSYQESKYMTIQILAEVLGINGEESFSMAELDVIEDILNEKNGLKFVLG